MRNVMVDSCVFFGMIEYNNFVREYGVENLQKYIDLRKSMLLELSKTLKKSLGNDFIVQFSNLSFDEQVEKYKEYSTNSINNCIKDIEKNKRIASGEVSPYITEEKKKKALEEIEITTKKLNSITPYESVEKLINTYRIYRNSLSSGLLYQGAINGDYKLFVNAYSYDEILNHSHESDNPDWLFFPREQIDSLSTLFTKIYTTSPTLIEKIDKLAKSYRTENNLPNDRAMDNDINSVNEYGDSKIAAFSNLVGIDLVTHNAKDFIVDKSHGKNNCYIKNHLQNVNKSFEGATDATVYTAVDFVSKKIPEPTIASKLKIGSQSKANSSFYEERNMEL